MGNEERSLVEREEKSLIEGEEGDSIPLEGTYIESVYNVDTL